MLDYQLKMPVEISFNKRKKTKKAQLIIKKDKIKLLIQKTSRSIMHYTVKKDDIMIDLEEYIYKSLNNFSNSIYHHNRYDKDFDDSKFVILLDKPKIDNNETIKSINIYFTFKQKNMLRYYLQLLKGEDNII